MRRRGFTLIELMIALAVGLFVVAALYRLFTDQVRQFVYQDLQMEMHQNQRLAADILTRTVRLAGYGTGGEVRGVFGAAGDADEVMPPITAYNGTGANGSDAITLVSMDPSLVMNTNFTQSAACTTDTLSFNPAILNNGAKLAQYEAGQLIMCYDYAAPGGFRSFMWSVTGVDATGGSVTVTDASGYADYAEDCPSDENLPLTMTCSQAEVVTFYIDADDSDGFGAGSETNPVLMMDLDFESPDDDDVPLVDNVEDLQFSYCLQSSSGTTDCTDSTAWSDTITSSEASSVYMIRIGLVVRSSREDPRDIYVGTRPELADNAAGTDTDHYFRQVVATEVVVRNMRIQMNIP